MTERTFGTAIAILFGLFYAYDLWEALATMISLPGVYEAYGLDPAGIPWWLLIANLLVPAVVYGITFALGLRRPLWARALLFGVGLALVAALSLGVIALQGALLV